MNILSHMTLDNREKGENIYCLYIPDFNLFVSVFKERRITVHEYNADCHFRLTGKHGV